MKGAKLFSRGGYFSYAGVYFFFMFCMAVFSSVLSVYLTGIGKTQTEASFIASSSGLFAILVSPLVGYVNDRAKKPKRLSGIMLLGAGAFGLIFSQCRSVWALFLLNGLVMSCINSVMPVCERMAGACPYRYGTVRIWGTLGYAVGAQVAGLGIQSLPPILLFGFLGLSAILAILCLLGVDSSSLSPEKKDSSTGEKPKLSSLLMNPRFLLFLLIAFSFLGASGANMTFMPLLLTQLGASPGSVGTVLFFSTLVELPLILFSHKFMDRFSGKTLMQISLGILALQFICYGLSRSLFFTVGVAILLKAVASTMFVMINLKMTRILLPPEFTTTGLGVVSSVTNLATILVQNLGGLLVRFMDIPALYLCLTAFPALGLILTLFLKVENRESVFS